ncbi:hypothetical protein [Sphingomonas sp.]|uniref:hypothetical protein n=1 Tax=Sphingomonas sp. TaxID=28214 RepID=UPI003AFF80AC
MAASLIATLVLAATQPGVSTAGTGCVRLLTGSWAGSGTVTEFGPPMKVSSTATYRADRSFVATTRYVGQDRRLHEQTSTGRWTATAGQGRRACTIALTSESAAGSSSSSSDVQIVDRDTFRSLGVDMHRTR